MKRLEQLAVLALLTLGFCGCTRTSEVKTDEKLAVQEEVHEKGRERTSETVQTGPGETTIYKFALPQAPIDAEDHEQWGDDNSADAALGASVGHPSVQPSASKMQQAHREMHDDGLPPHGPLVELDVIDTGPVLDTKSAVTQTAKTASLAEKQESKIDKTKTTKWGLPWWLWALGACGVALGIAIVRKTLLGKAVAAAEVVAKEVL